MRWRHGRTVTNAQGRAKTYAPISLSAPTISSRYLHEGERLQIADELQFKKESMISVYSCDSHSPWNLNLHSPERLAEVAENSDARPRDSRNWEPAQALR
jgi:hypothetical protein